MIEYGISYDISNTTDLLILLAAYGMVEIVKYFSRKIAADKRQKEMAKKLAAIEYTLYVQSFPDKDKHVMTLYGECKALGCNGHIDELHNEWLLRRKLKTIKND